MVATDCNQLYMAVVSISMPLELLDYVDEFVEDEAYTGRSEVVREACRGLLCVFEGEHVSVVGVASALVESGDETTEDRISTLEADYEPLVTETTQVSVAGEYTLVSFVLDGGHERARSFLASLRATPGTVSVRHSLTPLEGID